MFYNLTIIDDRSRYGFVTYQRARDAWSAVEAANTFPQYDVGFGGRRAFCRQSYADLGKIYFYNVHQVKIDNE